jgi:hypothetical protein
MATIVTHCDKYFASRAGALVESLLKDPFCPKIIVFAHDNIALDFLNLNYGDVIVVKSIEDVVSKYSQLQNVYNSKPKNEFMFALTPYLIKFISEYYEGGEAWYIDADIWFKNNFSELIPQVKNSDIAITPHNFSEKLKFLEKYGKFNVGIIYASSSLESYRIINWWADKCSENTELRPDGEFYGDQKYLDNFKSISKNVHVFKGLGINAAPWNCKMIYKENETFFCQDGSKLIAFHFSGFRKFKYYIFYGYSIYSWRPKIIIRNQIYKPYIKKLNEIENKFPKVRFFDTRKLSLRSIIKMFYYLDFQIEILSK